MDQHSVPARIVARNRKIAEQYESGASLADIARRHGISRQRVHQIISRIIASTLPPRVRVPLTPPGPARRYRRPRGG